MGWLISALGLLLALGGATSLAYGASYIRLDWGATEVIAGTTALSGGIVTLALGAVLFGLRGRAAPRARAAPDDASPFADRRSELAAAGVPKPTLAPMPDGAAPSLVAPAADMRPNLDPAPAMRFARPDEAEPAPSGLSRDAALHPAEAAPFAEADAPTVVGRYEANGASYVLFSDGTIEVETESGTHRFASMGDLKQHIERQEAV